MSIGDHYHTHTHQKNHDLHELLHKKKYVRALDRCVLVIGICGPVFTWPQIYQIWSTQEAEGLSLFTWSAWLIFTVFWIIYGLAHQEKPIIVANSLGAINIVLVIIGIILYA
jgi:uncharacterized protein with PQ loop repeat